VGEVKEEDKTLDAAGRPEGAPVWPITPPNGHPKSRQASGSASGVTDNS
jgi:hypothetical protein